MKKIHRMLTRREFIEKNLANAAAIASGSALITSFTPPAWARALLQESNKQVSAEGGKDNFFVLIRIEGGMDVTLGLDGKTKDRPKWVTEKMCFLEKLEDNTTQKSPDDGPDLILGAAAKPLAPHVNDIAVVNGIFMRNDFGHQDTNDYLCSGSFDPRYPGPFVSVELSNSIKGSSGNIMYSGVAPRIAEGYQVEPINLENVRGQVLSAVYSEILARGERGMNGASPLSRAKKRYLESQPQREELRKAVEASLSSGAGGMAEGMTAALSFLTGFGQFAQITISEFGMDTHNGHEDRHLGVQMGVWAQVAKILADFKLLEMFDRTTFMVTNDFSRTPALNVGKGKDHEFRTNSVLLAGRGISGGRAFGSSVVMPEDWNDGVDRVPVMVGNLFDPKQRDSRAVFNLRPEMKSALMESESVSGHIRLYPENVIRSVAKIFGDPESFRSIDLKGVDPIPGLVKA